MVASDVVKRWQRSHVAKIHFHNTMFRNLTYRILTLNRHLNIQSAAREINVADSSGTSSLSYVDPYVERLPSIKTSDDILIRLLGSPPSIATITMPPSVSTSIRRNSLILMEGAVRDLNFKLKFLDPLKSAIFDRRLQIYEEIVSTEPTSLLVSAQITGKFNHLLKRPNQKTFASLKLDGVTDWAILRKEALQVFGGPSIIVSKHKTPKNISRAFAKRLGSKRDRTGLSSLGNRGFTFIGGRGVAALVGNGLIFALTVKENEEIVINKHSILSVSVNGPFDLENCVVERQGESSNVERVVWSSLMPVKSWKDLITNYRKVLHFISGAFRWLQGKCKDIMWGHENFVRVWGPRTILLQSESVGLFSDLKKQLPHVEKSDPLRSSKSPKDYLNVVTCEPGSKPTIRSTDSFTS